LQTWSGAARGRAGAGGGGGQRYAIAPAWGSGNLGPGRERAKIQAENIYCAVQHFFLTSFGNVVYFAYCTAEMPAVLMTGHRRNPCRHTME
jgi:hypothetical protein